MDWKRLQQMREGFLAPSGKNYWESSEDLRQYEETFAQRIGWKWQAVLNELQSIGWHPKEACSVLDWACGTGIATRTYLDAFYPNQTPDEVFIWDRSPIAIQFAKSKIDEKNVKSGVKTWEGNTPKSFVLLISHVIEELNKIDLEKLLKFALKADSLIWVEPGTHTASRKLLEVRAHLTSRFNVLAPCTHQEKCPLLEEGFEKHWCHHFAKTPQFVSQQSYWAHFSNRLGIDLRSLVYSYLVLSKEKIQPKQGKRILGRPRLYKGYCRVQTCDRSGVKDENLLKRKEPKLLKRLKTPPYPILSA